MSTNYYCESGAHTRIADPDVYHFEDPLWDGSGCITSGCCDNPSQSWFYRELSGTVTSNIEVRICSRYPFSDASALIDQLELYIQ